MLRRTLTTALLAAAAVTLTACSTTSSFHSTWQNPAALTLDLRGRKVAALVLHENEALRCAAEDALAREITVHGGVGVPAYTLLPREAVHDKDMARLLLEQAQVEGIVAMRAVAWNTALLPNLGTYWGNSRFASFWGSAFWGWGGAHDGYLCPDTLLIVETLVYSLSQNKLVWASQSQTTNPLKVGPVIHELSRKIGAEMEKQGLLGDPARVSAVGF
jgi:hypothetical protein